METKINLYTASRLRGLRAEKQMSLEEVAEKTGVNKDTIRRYENSNVSMQLWILDRLADCYGMSLDIFFKNVYDNMQNETKEE